MCPVGSIQVTKIFSRILCVRQHNPQTSGSVAIDFRRLETLDVDSTSDSDQRQIVGHDVTTGGSEWQQLAVCIDRLCFILFVVIVFVTTFAFAE